MAPVFPVDDAYKRICQIGQGTFGLESRPWPCRLSSPLTTLSFSVVYKALAPDGSLVALKALRLNDMQHGVRFAATSNCLDANVVRCSFLSHLFGKFRFCRG